MSRCRDMEVAKMSTMYLDLRARIPVVAAKDMTQLPSDELRAAQERLGYSDEEMAVKLHVATKTWWRWRTTGRVSTVSIPSIARVLELDLFEKFDSPTPIRAGERPATTAESLAAVEVRLATLAASVDSLAKQVEKMAGSVETRLAKIEARLPAQPSRAARRGARASGQ